DERDDVVERRRPHVRPEVAPRVEHLAEERVHAVEEQLRHAPQREGDGDVEPRRVELGGVDRHEDTRTGGEDDGEAEQRGPGHGEEPVDVLVPAVALLHRPDDLRDEDGVEHAAGDEHVDDAGQLVGHGEGVRRAGEADRADERDVAEQAEHPGHERPGEHEGGGAGEAPTVVAHAVVTSSRRRPRRTVRTRPTTSMRTSSPAATAVPTVSQSARTRTRISVGSSIGVPSGAARTTSTTTAPLPTAWTGTCAVADCWAGISRATSSSATSRGSRGERRTRTLAGRLISFVTA